jgi:hypothetical protein
MLKLFLLSFYLPLSPGTSIGSGAAVRFLFHAKVFNLRSCDLSPGLGLPPSIQFLLFVYQRRILCTLYGAVDFLNVLKKGCLGGGGVL